jgi:hypothetical protein
MKLPGSVCMFLFLPGVLGTASADNRCARHSCPFCFAHHFFALRKRTASGFGPTTKFKGYAFRKYSEKLCGPPKKHGPKFGSNQPRVLVPKHSRGGKGKNS